MLNLYDNSSGMLSSLSKSVSTTTLLAQAIAEFNRRTPTWETKFSRWKTPASATETDKIERTEIMIREAIKADYFLSLLDLQIIVQGSYSNNTNIKGESDVDICVLMKNTYNYNTLPASNGSYCCHEITHTPPTITNKMLKDALDKALRNKFGVQYVKRDNKCIKIRSSTARVDADVVAANTYRLYTPTSGSPVTIHTPYLEGIAIHPDDNTPLIINWPLQHNSNGKAKNTITGGRYKAVVRIIKFLNLEMESIYYKPVQSFLVECLVYNCPNSYFEGEKLYDNVHKVLANLTLLSHTNGDTETWAEVNEIKKLFGSHQPWLISDAVRLARHAQVKIQGFL